MAVMSNHSDLGLRERKKRETRWALSSAALELALDRGLANVRTEDIAAQAGVSPRTFNNYFASKYEAIVWRHHERTRRTADVLRARPVDEPLWEAVIRAALDPLEGEGAGDRSPKPEQIAGVRLMFQEPELQSELMKAAIASESQLAAVVAERTGTDVERDMYPRLVAAAVGAAGHVATDQWLRADPPVPLLPLLRDALRQIAAGLPEPSAK
jgi:AcrR family transcriptional regulator